MGRGLGREGRAVCLIARNVLVKPCLRRELFVQRCDGNAERVCPAAGAGGLSDLVHAENEVAQGLYFHDQPPHDGVVAIAVADGSQLLGAERGVLDAEGVGHGANTVWIYSIVGRMLGVNVDNADVDDAALRWQYWCSRLLMMCIEMKKFGGVAACGLFLFLAMTLPSRADESGNKVVLKTDSERIELYKDYIGGPKENGVIHVLVKYPEMTPWRLGYDLRYQIYLAVATTRVWALRGESLMERATLRDSVEGVAHYTRRLGSKSAVQDIFRFVGSDGVPVTATAQQGRLSFVVTRGLGTDFSVQYACEVPNVNELRVVDAKILKFLDLQKTN